MLARLREPVREGRIREGKISKMMGYRDFGAMGGVGWVWMGLFWVVVLGAVIWGVRALSGRRASSPDPGALEILRQRYARGEIGEAEYEQAKRTLG
jgi:putative membrane protein